MQLGLSSCPNDTFVFHALLHGLVDTDGMTFSPVIDDVEALNARAFRSELPVTKLSFHTFMKIRDRYELLDAGAAFGFGCGPLVVARDKEIDLAGARVAVPGLNTTACMLLKAWNPSIAQIEPMRFDQILPAVQNGSVDAGVIIHEGRFVFVKYNCTCICDLGAWWEQKTRLPIPLGCIAIRKDPDLLARKHALEKVIRDSVLYARGNPDASRPFIRSFAGELDDDVIDAHIALYVNDYTLSLGEEGKRVILQLEQLL